MVTVAYDIVYTALKKAITTGVYPPKTLLPPEPQLCRMFSVSRTTVRKAIDMLVQDGYVKPQRGIGTIVLRRRAAQDLNKLSSLTETLKEKGYDVSLNKLEITIVKADEVVAEKLNINIGEPVVCVFRVTCATGTPIAILQNYIPYALVQGIEAFNGKFVSLYRLLEEEFSLTIERTKDLITASNATELEAKLLDVAYGFALINVDRVCLSGSKAICYDIVNARSDMYEYHTSLFNK